MEFEELKARIKADVKQCIIKGDKEPQDCLDTAISKYGVNGPNEEKIRRMLGDR